MASRPLPDPPVTEAFLDIKHWGNNLGVRLPAAVAKAANLRADQRVRVAVEDGRVVLTPVAVLTLAQRLAMFDPEVHAPEGEIMALPPEGAERW